jgi:hypothetical protein
VPFWVEVFEIFSNFLIYKMESSDIDLNGVAEAYSSGNLTPLQEKAKSLIQNGVSTDQFFWSYLSLDPYLFSDTYNFFVQTETGNFWDMTYPLEQIIIRDNDQCNISPGPSRILDNYRIVGYDYYYSANQQEAHLYMDWLLDNKLKAFINEITQLPGIVIAGGLPASCIYQKWSSRCDAQSSISNTIEGTTIKPVPYDYDVDIFFIDPASVMQNINYIVEASKRHLNTNILFAKNTNSPNVYTLAYEDGTHQISIQLIARLYININQVALGFDLDSSCAFYYGGVFMVHKRFILAVTYGQNLINPYRESHSYMYRLAKYMHRGFSVHIPGDLNRHPKLLGPYLISAEIMATNLNNKTSDYAGLIGWLGYPGGGIGPENVVVRTKGRETTIYPISQINLNMWISVNPGTQIVGSFSPLRTDILRNGFPIREDRINRFRKEWLKLSTTTGHELETPTPFQKPSPTTLSNPPPQSSGVRRIVTASAFSQNPSPTKRQR